MKISLQSLVLLLMALMVPATATAAYEQLAEGVYQDGTTLYIGSGVTSLGDLQVNPSVIYCYATIPPACMSNTFTGYDAVLHVPAAGMVSYFTTLYWYNFNNILSDAIEPLSVTMNTANTELEIGQQLSLSATVAPGDATPKTVCWSSTDASVATVSAGGTVTAVATGECDILATCVDKVAVCHVTVVNPRVTITLDKHVSRLLPNHTMTLTATCSPIDVDLAVTSSDPEVALPRLVNGTIMVVGVTEGTATITVNAADGWGHPDSCIVTVYTEHGDVNCDGYVSIADVTSLIDFLLSGDDSHISTINADVNKSDNISIADVTTLIDYLLSGIWPWQHDMSFIVNGVSFKMVFVDGGTFTMGATEEQGGDAYDDENPVHQVTLSEFCIGETEVTQALWQAVMGSNPSNYTGNLNRPVDHVFWSDCQEFISKLNKLTGKHFRLPTEAEWEYAARGGNKSKGYKYAGSDDINEVAWYSGNADNITHTVATKSPNELGVYDMSGNVREWCQDWFGGYSSDAQSNPLGPSLNSYSNRVYRGGCYGDHAEHCRISKRGNMSQYATSADWGLRLALDDNILKFHLSETFVELMLGESKDVSILNGDGNYTVEGGMDCVSSVLNGNLLTITGKVSGATTVFITDNVTGSKVYLNIIVKDREEFTVNDVSFTMVTVEGGTFMMGRTAEQGDFVDCDELPTHMVRLSSFCIGQTEVTQALWQAVMGSNPSHNKSNMQNPVERVSWDDCQTFITILNELTGKTFRLPTEAEWEFAARGGNMSLGYRYSGSNDPNEVANYRHDLTTLDDTSIPVGWLHPNELGLYDMSGNVMEWCQDWYGDYSSNTQLDPVGPESGTDRVCRGGAYYTPYYSCYISRRFHFSQSSKSNWIGLRLVL